MFQMLRKTYKNSALSAVRLITDNQLLITGNRLLITSTPYPPCYTRRHLPQGER